MSSQSISLYNLLAKKKQFKKTINFDLKRIKLALNKLNNPERKLKNVINIIGSDGKYSVLNTLKYIIEEKKSFLTTLYIFSVAFVLSSSLIYYAEHKVQPEAFRSIPDAMYWSIITLTTVGYGDVSPITVFGKSIAAITAIFGVVVVALLTGIVANSFNAQMARRKVIFEDQVRNALLDGVLDSDEEASLDALRKQFGMSKLQADALINHVKKTRENPEL